MTIAAINAQTVCTLQTQLLQTLQSSRLLANTTVFENTRCYKDLCLDRDGEARMYYLPSGPPLRSSHPYQSMHFLDFWGVRYIIRASVQTSSRFYTVQSACIVAPIGSAPIWFMCCRANIYLSLVHPTIDIAPLT